MVRVGGHAYGVPVASVVEVVRMVALSPFPDGPPWMAGLADLRGLPVPVVDLAARLGHVSRAPVVDRRIVVAGDPAAPFGLVVDDVPGVAPAGPPAGVDRAAMSPLVRQVVRIGEDMVMVLDEAALWPDDRA